MLGSCAAFAWPTRLNAAATRRSAATISGRRSSICSGKPGWHRSGQRRQIGARTQLGGRVAAEQQLERAHRRLVRITRLHQRIARAPGWRRRSLRVLLVAGADAKAIAGQAHQNLGRAHHVGGQLLLAQGLRGDEPGLRGGGGDRLASELAIGLHGGQAGRCGCLARNAAGPTGRAPTTPGR